MFMELETISALLAPDQAAGADDDFDLLRRYAGLGDPHAFAEIVQKYSGFVYSTCLRVIGDAARAEDLSQETFFRLMRRPHEVRRNLGGWLHRTATHVSLDALRSESSRRRREIVYSRECDHESSTWAELSPAVDQALTEMPEETRWLLVQHFLLGKSQAELAEKSHLSASTISRRMQQALIDLRQQLRLKGIYALPAALATLLCHVTARQAPASLLRELGKMAMVSGSAASSPGIFSARNVRNPAPIHLISRFASPQMIMAFLGMAGALLILELLAVLWTISPTQPTNPHADPPPKTATLRVWTNEVSRENRGLNAAGGLQKAPTP
jgi:RNA polymerase sigma-70 factor (ECF subfamily)